MTTDRETIDALLDDVIEGEDEADDLDEPHPFVMALDQCTEEQRRELLKEDIRIIERITGTKGVTFVWTAGDEITLYGRND